MKPLAALVSVLFLTAADWPQFLGPDRTGRSAETGLNWDWEKAPPKVLWKAPIGAGYSSVSVVGDRVYTMVNRGERDLVIALDAASGKELWKYDAGPKYLDTQRQGPGPRSTPTHHNGKLYCLLPLGDLLCLSTEGKPVWRVNILAETGVKSPEGQFYFWGIAHSPLVDGDNVIVQPGGTNGNCMAAFHKETGKLVWKGGDGGYGYGSPIIVQAAGVRQLIAPGGNVILALDPATGAELWSHPFGNGKFNCNCATPVFADGVLFYSAAYGVGAVGLELTTASGKPAVKELWRHRKFRNQFTTSMAIDGFAYGCDGDLGASTLACVELKTGTVKWTDSKPGKCGLIAADGHLVVLSERGTLRAVKATPEDYAPTGELKDLLTFKSWAAPALADGRLYVRDDKNLICLDLRKP